MKALGWWLIAVGTLRLASVWFSFFDIWALKLAVFSNITNYDLLVLKTPGSQWRQQKRQGASSSNLGVTEDSSHCRFISKGFLLIMKSLNCNWNLRKNELELRKTELEKCEAHNESERKKLAEEIEEKMTVKTPGMLASKIDRTPVSTPGGPRAREEKIVVTVRLRPLNRREQLAKDQIKFLVLLL